MTDVDYLRGRHRGSVRDGWSGLIARLSISGRLSLLVLLPLAAAVLAAGPFVAAQASDAAAAGRTAQAAANTRTVAALMGELQAERLLMSSFLASPGDDGTTVRRQQRTVDETVDRVRTELGAGISDELAAALVRTRSVQEVRDIAAVRGVSPDRVARSYHAVIEALVDALRLVSRQDSDDARGARQLTALDALLRGDEFAELRGAALVAAAVDPKSGQPLLDDSGAQAGLFVERFVQQADTDLAGLVVGVTEGQSAQAAAALGTRLPDPGNPAAVAGFSGETVRVVSELAVSRASAREQVTSLIAGSAVKRASGAGITAWAVGLGTALVILLVAALSVLVSRSIAIPLRRLTDGARDITGLVTNLAEQELADVSDRDQRVDIRLPQPAPIEVASDDELGRLTVAFNQMRATAVGLIDRQIVTRQNVSLMFANVAQRTQNLVSRQLALVDELERNEQDAGMLASLYRLDHLSTRLRRNADNLLVVAGAREEIGVSGPTDLSTALRAALAQIEDYKRVGIADPPDLELATSGVGADLVLLFAELLENATSFSPPTASVEVEARPGAGGSCDVVIVDHGMGMPADRLADENKRLVERERLDVAPTTVLGLFVVGRISRRHGLSVQLFATQGGGVTVRVSIPARLLVRRLPVVVEAPADRRLLEAGPHAIPAIVIPSAMNNGPFTWFADDAAANGRASAGPGAGGFGPRVSNPPPRVAGGAFVETTNGSVAAGPRDGADTRGGLRRREAGAQLPDAGRVVTQAGADRTPVQRRPHHDPSIARSELGEFEAGFSRAASGTTPAGLSSAPADVPPSAVRRAPASSVPGGRSVPSGSSVRSGPAARSVPGMPTRPAVRSGPPAPTGHDGPAPAAQRSGLTRRVPGTNMVPELRSGPPSRQPPGGQARRPLRRPEEERDQFDAFQDAVARSAQHDPTKETTA